MPLLFESFATHTHMNIMLTIMAITKMIQIVAQPPQAARPGIGLGSFCWAKAKVELIIMHKTAKMRGNHLETVLFVLTIVISPPSFGLDFQI